MVVTAVVVVTIVVSVVVMVVVVVVVAAVVKTAVRSERTSRSGIRQVKVVASACLRSSKKAMVADTMASASMRTCACPWSDTILSSVCLFVCL